MKAVFKNNYTWKSGSKCPEGMIGCAPESINYKKGDVFGGIAVSLSNDKKQVISNLGNFSVQIPVENFTILNDDGTPFDTRVVAVTPTPSKDVSTETFLQKHKNHLLIAGALIVGYLAYKKFKK